MGVFLIKVVHVFLSVCIKLILMEVSLKAEYDISCHCLEFFETKHISICVWDYLYEALNHENNRCHLKDILGL